MASLQALLPSTLVPLQRFLLSKTLLIPTCMLCTWKLVQRLNSHLSTLSLNNFENDVSWDWTHEIVLVTGGSSGIGAEVARRLSSRSIKVVIWDLVAPPADLLNNKHVTHYLVDVTSDTSVATAAARLRQDVGDPTVLINNAGIAVAETILDETAAQRRAQFEVNVFAQMRLVQEFLPAMAEQNHGHVVTMASASSFISTTQLVTYGATKAAVMAFHEGLGQELRMRYGARKVRTSIVFPHFVRTPMVEKLTSLEGFPELLLTPGYVADAVVAQVLSGKAGRLVLPPANAWLARLRAWPPWYMYYVHSLDQDVYRKRV
ncbi:uncharacterized protein EKO05_0006931 [Ascochyta rabiei]|uniref:uncharacterized protein n=1 Tax=Didymella rabiei TaxID=5454 RepID=UPI0019025788|nr:uncharacterized protein EKO05_0006931 [Ascochyta rabiei]UPX16536.1 hypothetical protein EKO05_0006931 [Ascochyta rabiei]